MKKPKSSLLAKLLLSSVLLGGVANAAQITQDNATTTSLGSNIMGQSFTATGTETITSIQVANTDVSAPTVTLRIYSGQTNCETVPGGGAPAAGALFTQAGYALPDTNPVTPGDVSGQYTTLTLGTPLAITNGQQYTFCLQATAGILSMAVDNANPYGGGQEYWDGIGFTAGRDLAFRINVAAAAAAAPFSPLGLLSIFLAIGAVGAFGTKRQLLKTL